MASPVKTYEVNVFTGPREGARAELSLYGAGGQNGLLGVITFYDPVVKGLSSESEHPHRGFYRAYQLHTDMLASVLDLLNSEVPVFVGDERLTTREEDSFF